MRHVSVIHKYDYDVKTSDDESLFLPLNLSAVLKKSTLGKFAYTCHFQQIGINATKIEKREFILKLTFSLPLPSSMLKLPNVATATATRASKKQ